MRMNTVTVVMYNVELIYSIDFGEKLPRKAVLLSFGDAYTDHYLNVNNKTRGYNKL